MKQDDNYKVFSSAWLYHYNNCSDEFIKMFLIMILRKASQQSRI